MKKLYSIFAAAFLISANLFAQGPDKMSYQAVIRNNTNQLESNQKVGMRISILQTSATGTSVYQETHTATTNASGLVNIEIGTGVIESESFASINWANGPYFLKTETDIAGGTNYTITGTTQLLSVPYAKFADKFSGDMNYRKITNMLNPTDYYEATNKGYVDLLLIELMDHLAPSNEGYSSLISGWVKDVEGNAYGTVKINDQWWMTGNLYTTRYNDGTLIPNAGGDETWKSTEMYGWYNNDLHANYNPYGALYNFQAVNTGKICPVGWRVPTELDWAFLLGFTGGPTTAGGKLKYGATFFWLAPNTGATDEFGFGAVPGGYRNSSGSFQKGFTGYYWSSTSTNVNTALIYSMSNTSIAITAAEGDKQNGYSVKCVRNK